MKYLYLQTEIKHLRNYLGMRYFEIDILSTSQRRYALKELPQIYDNVSIFFSDS